MYYLALILYLQGIFNRVSSSSTLISIGSFEHRIRAELLNDYDKTVLPVESKKQLEVKFALKIIKLLQVDTITQIITVEAWMAQSWTNEFLQWNKSEFGDLDVIHFQPDEVWLPDMSLFNNAADDDTKRRILFGTVISVDSKGSCTLKGPTILKASCEMQLQNWPFDNQTCNLAFGSYTYGIDTMAFRLIEVKNAEDKFGIADRFVSNGDWELDDISTSIGTTDHERCCATAFSEVVYTLKITRKPLFYLFYLVGPCAILLFLNLTSFLIPVESGERIGFVTTILLAMTVFLLLMSSLLPETSSGIPLLGFSMAATLIIMCLVLLSNILVLKLFFMEGNPPEWVQSLFRLFKKRDGKRVAQIQDVSSANGQHLPSVESPGSIHVIQTSEHVEGIDKVDKGLNEKEEEFTWQKVSVKLDNAFFVLFSLIAVISYAAIFFKPFT